jgi:hypothetical protein
MSASSAGMVGLLLYYCPIPSVFMHEFPDTGTGRPIESGGIIWEVPANYNIMAGPFAPRRARGAPYTET